jgi:3-dehydroquinate synthetase
MSVHSLLFEEIESLRQQLAEANAALNADWGDDVMQSNLKAKAQLAERDKQVVMLRDALEFIPISGSMLGHAAEMKRKEALAATEPKP